MIKIIDLNADLGEGIGDDEAILTVVSTANVAAGAHAGGGAILKETLKMAVEAGVSVGAHISYPDRENFGRISMKNHFTQSILETILIEQILTVGRAAQEVGLELSHVKAHGALYNDACDDRDIAEVTARACLAANLILTKERAGSENIDFTNRDLFLDSLTGLPIMGMPNTIMEEVASEYGCAFIREAFADRTYTRQGRLTPRSQEGAVHSNPDKVLEQALGIALNRSICSFDGIIISADVDTICLHGDTPGAVLNAKSIKTSFLQNGIAIKALGKRI